MNDIVSKVAALEWGKVVGIGVLLAVLYYFGAYNDGARLSESISQAQTRLKTGQAQLAQTEKALEDANRFEMEVQTTARQFEKIIDFMPASISAGDLTTIINRQTQLSGMRAAAVKPRTEILKAGFYETSRVEMELEGSFGQVVTFLSYMSRVPKLLTFEGTEITQVSAGSENAASTLKFKSVLVGYRYLKDAPMDPAAATGAKAP